MKRREFIQSSAILGASVVAVGIPVGKALGLLAPKESRSVLQVLNAGTSMVGDLPILRAFPGNELDYVSPYVLLDEFGPVKVAAGADRKGVGAHPHAGVTPTTYLISGTNNHIDSLNYNLQHGAGDFMLFSSGRGAIHAEYTGQDTLKNGGIIHGFQIWLNTPGKYKFADPSTVVHSEAKLPTLETEHYSIRIVIGELNGKRSPTETYSPAFYYHVNSKPGAKVTFPVDPEHNAFIYMIDGEVELKDQVMAKKNQLALFERDKAQIDVYSKGKAEYLLMGGQPLNERVVSYGPFVMNTEDQIRKVIRDYQMGRMGDPAEVR